MRSARVPASGGIPLAATAATVSPFRPTRRRSPADLPEASDDAGRNQIAASFRNVRKGMAPAGPPLNRRTERQAVAASAAGTVSAARAATARAPGRLDPSLGSEEYEQRGQAALHVHGSLVEAPCPPGRSRRAATACSARSQRGRGDTQRGEHGADVPAPLSESRPRAQEPHGTGPARRGRRRRRARAALAKPLARARESGGYDVAAWPLAPGRGMHKTAIA